MAQQKVHLSQFNVQELYQLRQGFQSELNTLMQSMNQFRFAKEKYQEGVRAIKAAQDCKPHQQMMIPLSNALYIEGHLDNFVNEQKVYLIEYGAGFFVQRNAKQAVEFYQRKINLIKQKSQKLEDIINQKKEGLKQVELRIYSLTQQAQQMTQQQAK